MFISKQKFYEGLWKYFCMVHRLWVVFFRSSLLKFHLTYSFVYLWGCLLFVLIKLVLHLVLLFGLTSVGTLSCDRECLRQYWLLSHSVYCLLWDLLHVCWHNFIGILYCVSIFLPPHSLLVHVIPCLYSDCAALWSLFKYNCFRFAG